MGIIAIRQAARLAIGKPWARAYSIPTDQPEADSTFPWSQTTLIVTQVAAGNATGLGYTDADASVAPLINGTLAGSFEGSRPFEARLLDISLSTLLGQECDRGAIYGSGGFTPTTMQPCRSNCMAGLIVTDAGQ